LVRLRPKAWLVCEEEGWEVVFSAEPTRELGRLLNRDGMGDEEVLSVFDEMAAQGVPEEPSGYVN